VWRCAGDGHVDAARLPDVVAGLLKEDALRKPKLLVAYAFDILVRRDGAPSPAGESPARGIVDAPR